MVQMCCELGACYLDWCFVGLTLLSSPTTRDATRGVLVQMCCELGPRYLPYAVEVLQSSLPDRGFTAHVVGYSLHAILAGLIKVCGLIHDSLSLERRIGTCTHAPVHMHEHSGARPAGQARSHPPHTRTRTYAGLPAGRF